jgi:glycosyltransferase involved in cell wall biosynthesis
MPRCSVVIPAFNAERWVADAVRSALAQTYVDREIVVVNDGSTDGTATALDPLKHQIIYVEQPNRGVSAARNHAIGLASGELIALLDADNTLYPQFLERLIGYLDAHLEAGFVSTPMRSLPRSRRFRTSDQTYWITQYNFVASQCVVRKRLFDRHGLFDEQLPSCEDWQLWIRLIAAGERVGLVPERLAFYRRHAQALTADFARNWQNEWKMLESVRSKLGYLPGLDARLEIARGRHLLLEGDVRSAKRHFLRAVGNHTLAGFSRLQTLPFTVAPTLSIRAYEKLFAARRRRS